MKNYLKKAGIAMLGLGSFLYTQLAPIDVNAGTKFGQTITGENQTQNNKNIKKTDSNDNNSFAGNYGGNLTAFYVPTQSDIKYLDEQNGVNTHVEGNLIGGNIYARIPVNDKIVLVPLFQYTKINSKLSNSANSDLGSVETNKLKGGVLAQLYLREGKLFLETGADYESQTTNTQINPINENLEETVKNIELELRAKYNFTNGNTTFGPIVGTQVNITEFNQDILNKNATTYDFEVGGFAEGNGLEGSLVVKYDQTYDLESESTLNGVSVVPQVKVGNNTYAFAGGEFTVADNGINRNLFLIGVGQEKFKLNNTIKLPVGWRVAYFTNTQGYDNNITNVETTQNGFIFTIELNDSNWSNSSLSPLNLIPKNR